jgi:hypothetical protein
MNCKKNEKEIWMHRQTARSSHRPRKKNEGKMVGGGWSHERFLNLEEENSVVRGLHIILIVLYYLHVDCEPQFDPQ